MGWWHLWRDSPFSFRSDTILSTVNKLTCSYSPQKHNCLTIHFWDRGWFEITCFIISLSASGNFCVFFSQRSRDPGVIEELLQSRIHGILPHASAGNAFIPPSRKPHIHLPYGGAGVQLSIHVLKLASFTLAAYYIL